MSGHSKWSTIKRQKGINDARRGQLFSKLARAITLAARQGGADPSANFKLRLVIDKARGSNMPKENIDRALRAAAGKLAGQLYEVVYEGYGPGGVAIMVEAATDNKNRTAQEIKNIFEKGDGSLGTPGSVAYQFEPKGLILTEKTEDLENTMLALIDLGAEDVQEVDDGIEVSVKANEVFQMKEKIEQTGVKIKSAEVTMQPVTTISTDSEKEIKLLKLIENLDEHDDVQRVFVNLE